MKTFVALAVSIVLVSILFCPLAMAAPSMPNDVQMVQPDPSLPKEIAGFWGKWEGSDQTMELFIIVEKIDEEKASLYIWRSGYKYEPMQIQIPEGWERIEATVNKEYGKYELYFRDVGGWWGGFVYLALKGEYLDVTTPGGHGKFSRVP
ncbi:MAG: hypothetical protein ABSB22_25290 [Thermodesulfobacteriota bacterium]|jgi:hypothetical protein